MQLFKAWYRVESADWHNKGDSKMEATYFGKEFIIALIDGAKFVLSMPCIQWTALGLAVYLIVKFAYNKLKIRS